MKQMFLLPLPPSPNKVPTHWVAKMRMKHGYMTQVFADASEQYDAVVHPPEAVRISACFFVRQLRDEDNLAASLKWVLDAMKKVQHSKSTLRWKGHVDRAWFHDDDPHHMTLDTVIQHRDPKNPRLELTIEELLPSPYAGP